MLPSEMIQLLKNYGFDDLDDTQALELLNDGKNAVATAEPWPALEKTADFATDANSLTMVAQPTDIASILGLYDITNGHKLQPLERDAFMNRYIDRLDETAVGPWFYYIFAGKLNVWPLTTTPVLLRADYIFLPPDMTADDSTEPLWLPKTYHRLIPVHALANANQLEGDMDVALQFEAEYDRRLDRMRRSLWAKQYDRPQMIEDVYENDWCD